jgi:hypothetical protein
MLHPFSTCPPLHMRFLPGLYHHHDFTLIQVFLTSISSSYSSLRPNLAELSPVSPGFCTHWKPCWMNDCMNVHLGWLSQTEVIWSLTVFMSILQFSELGPVFLQLNWVPGDESSEQASCQQSGHFLKTWTCSVTSQAATAFRREFLYLQ